MKVLKLLIRILGSLVMIYFAYGETGHWTAGCLVLFLIGIEGQVFINDQITDTMRNHKDAIKNTQSVIIKTRASNKVC